MIKYLDEEMPFQQLVPWGELHKNWSQYRRRRWRARTFHSNVDVGPVYKLFLFDCCWFNLDKRTVLTSCKTGEIVVDIFFSLGHSLGSYLRRNFLSDFGDKICNCPFSSRNIISDRTQPQRWNLKVLSYDRYEFGSCLSNILRRRRIHVIKRMWDCHSCLADHSERDPFWLQQSDKNN